MAYRDFGGHGRTVMLLHGVGGNLAHWGPVAPLLQDRYRLIAVDLPSHGASTAPTSYSFDHDVDAVDQVRRRLNLDRPALVGHSYGGMLAVALGARHPGDYHVVVNIDGVGFALGSEAEPEVQTERLSVAEWASAGDAAWLADQICREVEEAAEVGLQLDPAGEMVRRVFQLGSDGLWHSSPTLGRFVEIVRAVEARRLLPTCVASTCRTITVIADQRRGADDEDAAVLRRHVERLRAALVAEGLEVETVRSGHYPHVEVPEVLAERFSGWIGS